MRIRLHVTDFWLFLEKLHQHFLFQNRKRRSQDYPHHNPFTTLPTLPNTTLRLPHLSAAFPFPCSIKASLPGVWTKDQESLSQKLCTHGAARLLGRRSLALQGWVMTKLLKTGKFGDFFSPKSFWKESTKRRNLREFRWFSYSTWLKHHKCQYLQREMYDYVLSVELRVMFLFVGTQ